MVEVPVIPKGSGHLVVTRTVGETIRIGDDITIVINDIQPGRVRIGVICPKKIPVDRGEVYERRKREE